ncbi:MAG: Sapep family Mn(2+)-dependent dipeptidase [Erysipelotrichaceae bacterium]|nr:Sapep family Mn(2+)-dependent dipeptidase [Erysipelotrichaceae bacterium]
MEVREFIEKNIENMKKDLGRLVECPSVYSDDMEPFGKANHEVLDRALAMMEEKDLKTTNLDYYCGFGETGEGDKLIGILAHLDVVPAGDGWDSDPFVMVEKDGKLYGRGVSDDKGAAVASMYALKYLIQENYPFKKRVRLILGCNEETGSKCIRHYVEKQGDIDCGFTPDGDFPGIYAEKGMVGALITGKNSKIISISGGDVSNAVCKRCEATVPKGSFDVEKFKKFLMTHNITFEISENEDSTTLVVYGKAAHASMPDEGINALHFLLEGLYAADFNDTFTDWFHKHFALNLHGELLGYEKLKDDITDTSINLGVVFMKDGVINITLDMRFPVKTNSDEVVKLLNVNDENNEIIIKHRTEPLFFDQSTPFIKALKKAYVDLTGDETPMQAIGGGTYAKAIHNCIAWGSEFVGENNNIHGANESLVIDNWKKQVELYIEAIRNLNEIAL